MERRARLMLDVFKRDKTAGQEKGFYDFKASELTRILKDFLGREDTYGVDFRFRDHRTIYVFFMGRWIQVFWEQLKIYF